MATWKTDEVPVSIRFRGVYDFVGPAGTVFYVPDALYDEIDADLRPGIPGFTWLTVSDSATSMVLAELDGSPSGTATKMLVPNGSLSFSGSTATLAITADPDSHGITSTYHSAAGLTTGDVMRATAADGFGFGKIGGSAITQVYSSTISGAIDPSYITQVYQSVISPAISAGISSHDITGAYHTATGLTVGHVLQATASNAFGFGQIGASSISGAVASAIRVSLDTAGASDYVARIKTSGDSVYRAAVGLSSASVGQIAFGSGTAAADVVLRRRQPYSLVVTTDQTGAYSQLDVFAPAGGGSAQIIVSAAEGTADGDALVQVLAGQNGTAYVTMGSGAAGDIRLARTSDTTLSIDAGALTASATVNVVGTLQQNGTAVSVSGHTHAGSSALTVAEIDGSPATTVDRLVFPNGTVAISGSTATYTPAAAGSGITIEEIDGSPTTTATKLVFPNGAVAISGATATALFAQSKNGGMEVVSTVASAGASQTLNLANGNVFDLTLTSNTCTLTFSGATSGAACGMTIIARQDSTGGRTLAWPGAVSWSEGSAPTQNTTASSVSIYNFLTVDGGTTWYGFASDATGTTLTVSEIDGSPATTVSRVVFPNGTLSISGATATYTPAATGTAIQVSHDSASASDHVARIKTTGDTAYRVEIGLNSASTGRIVFGNGTSPSDVEINRYTAGYLQLVPTGGTGSFAVVSAQTSTAVSRIELTGGSVGQSKMVMYHSGEANTRVDLATTTAGGRISFGPGTAAADLYFQRTGAAAGRIDGGSATSTVTLNVVGTLQQSGTAVSVEGHSHAGGSVPAAVSAAALVYAYQTFR